MLKQNLDGAKATVPHCSSKAVTPLFDLNHLDHPDRSNQAYEFSTLYTRMRPIRLPVYNYRLHSGIFEGSMRSRGTVWPLSVEVIATS